MLLRDCLDETHQYATPEQWGVVQRSIPQDWIEQALAATGTATLRRRRLPMEQALWLVLGIAVLRDRSILGAAQALDLALPGASLDATASRAISSSALSQARQRLGAEPLQWLFQHTAAQWAHQEAGRHRWHGLSVYALDGVVWRTPDTQDNRESFGGQRNHAEHQSPFPQVRMACLLDARARLLVDQPAPLLLQPGQHPADLVDAVGQVMQTRTAALEEARVPAVGARRLEQLDPGVPELKDRHAHALVDHLFLADQLQPELVTIEGHLGCELLVRDADVGNFAYPAPMAGAFDLADLSLPAALTAPAPRARST